MRNEEKKLREIIGIEVDLGEAEVTELGAILVYEAPLIEHVQNVNGEDCLLKWSDRDSNFDRWMLYRVPPSRLLDFFNEEVNLRDLILENPDDFVLFFDYESKGSPKPVKVTKVKTKDIPKWYLPFEESYYKKNDFMYYEYCEQLRQQLEARLSPKSPYKIQPESSPSVLNEPPAE